MLDLAIVGSGPAALTAAIYATRAGLKVKVFEKGNIGGTLPEISYIENYPGFLGNGAELAEKFKSQAESLGAEIVYGECEKVESGALVIDGEKIVARAILIATGSAPKKLDIAGVTVPISYCALCDGALYKDKRVAVVGGGNSAIQESAYLAEFASEVAIFSRSKIKANTSAIEKLGKNVTVMENIEVDANTLNQFDAVFAFIGKTPATGFLPSELLDDGGFIKTENHQTAISGIFAAGDVRANTTKQIIIAAADGASATIHIIDFLKK
ncbi:MAG: FAD-dependent oxidoreductase [Candidatus Saccharibacteria bacterium]|nr:FAD-dependent oxidoreductase [Candidatus Saccharibacteria bacterium]